MTFRMRIRNQSTYTYVSYSQACTTHSLLQCTRKGLSAVHHNSYERETCDALSCVAWMFPWIYSFSLCSPFRSSVWMSRVFHTNALSKLYLCLWVFSSYQPWLPTELISNQDLLRDLYTCATALRSQNPHHSLHRLLPDQMAITSGEYPLEIFLLWIVSEILHHFYQRSIFLHLRLLNLLACIMNHIRSQVA